MSRFRRATATIAAAIYLMAAMLAPALATPHKLSFASDGGAHAATAQPHAQHLHRAHKSLWRRSCNGGRKRCHARPIRRLRGPARGCAAPASG